jgi:hypothetical protein
VLNAANGILRTSVVCAQISGPCTARVVKYIAKRAAKNMSSLESHTIVPTATKLGRVILWCELTLVLVMDGIIPEKGRTNLFKAPERALNFRVISVKRVTRK